MEDGSLRRVLATESNFDEDAYLAANPDIAQALKERKIRSARDHFSVFGVHEGRKLLLRVTEGNGTLQTTEHKDRQSGLNSILRRAAKGLIQSGFPGFSEKAIRDQGRDGKRPGVLDAGIADPELKQVKPGAEASQSNDPTLSNPLINPGVVCLNQQDHAIAQKTIIVVGIPRSGTSMVASAMECLGVFMGQYIDKAVFEDIAIAHALESGDVAKLQSLIENRNRSHNVWGFKRPAAFNIMESFVHYFRNPCFIITYRDPLAIAKRNEISMHMEFPNALLAASRQQIALTQFALKLKQPAMLVSYEKALLDPNGFVKNLAEFCNIDADASLIHAASKTVVNGPELYLAKSSIKN